MLLIYIPQRAIDADYCHRKRLSYSESPPERRTFSSSVPCRKLQASSTQLSGNQEQVHSLLLRKSLTPSAHRMQRNSIAPPVM